MKRNMSHRLSNHEYDTEVLNLLKKTKDSFQIPPFGLAKAGSWSRPKCTARLCQELLTVFPIFFPWPIPARELSCSSCPHPPFFPPLLQLTSLPASSFHLLRTLMISFWISLDPFTLSLSFSLCVSLAVSWKQVLQSGRQRTTYLLNPGNAACLSDTKG